MPLFEVDRAVKDLIAARLVVEESADQFAFRHALAQEAVYRTLLVRERKRHHQMIAQALEHLHADSVESYLPDLANHYYEAGIWDKALEYSQRAGEKAQAMYAPREASAHFTRALEAAQQLPGDSSTTTLHRARGRAFETLGDFEGARADYEASLKMAHAANDRKSEWQALLDLGFLWASRDYARTGEYFRQALALARALGAPATLGHTLNRVGNWYTNIEQPHEGLNYHREALDIFQKLNDKRGLAETFDLLGLTYILAADWLEGDACYEKAIPLLRELDDRQGLASALATHAERGVIFFDGPTFGISFPDVFAEATEALKLAREIDFRPGEVYAQGVLSALYESTGEIGLALDLLQSALQLAQEIGHRVWATSILQALGGLYIGILELDRAQQYLERAVAAARETDSLLFVRQSSSWLASTYILKGERQDLERADEVLKSALESDMQLRTLGQRLCAYARVELALARGESAEAWQILNDLEPDANNTPRERIVPRLWKLRGETLMQLGRLDEAETSLQSALGVIPKEAAGPLEWQIHLALGKVYRRGRRRDQAKAEFDAARQIIQDLAATIPDESLKSNFKTKALAMIPIQRKAKSKQ